MYIIAIAWLYVVILMAVTEKSVTAGLLTFIFYGLLPCALLLWLLGSKHRQRYRKKTLSDDNMREPNGANSQTDE
jgi:biotin transporter BioY